MQHCQHMVAYHVHLASLALDNSSQPSFILRMDATAEEMAVAERYAKLAGNPKRR